MFDNKPRRFTFRCDACKEILCSEFDDEQDIQEIVEDKLWLECECGGKAKLLRD